MRFLDIALAGALSAATPLAAQAPAPPPPAAAPAQPGYADLADLASAARVVAVVEIASAQRLKGADAAGVPAGVARLYVEARLVALLRGAGGLPAQVRYLADVPLDARGRPPRLRRARMLLFAVPVAGRSAELRLLGGRGQQPWTPGLEARTRTLLTQLVSPTAPPRVTGIANAFHVAGSLPGESETQIFLATEDGRPVSLSVLRRPGQAPRWAAALGEMVDDAAAAPARETLLWYRLACGLPPALPDAAVAELDAAGAAAARADYAVILAGLGACGRTPGG